MEAYEKKNHDLVIYYYRDALIVIETYRTAITLESSHYYCAVNHVYI